MVNAVVGNIGLFYACYCLSWHGWNALPTIRNAKGADIIVVSEQGKKIGIQVKTVSGKNDIFLGKNYADPSIDFWIILTEVRKDDFPQAFIIPSEDIIKGVDLCKSGVNSNENLIYHDIPRGDSTTFYVNTKFLYSKEHNYKEFWDSIPK